MTKVGFIGCGKLGMPCAEAIAQKGHDVSGYDVVKRTSDYVTMFPTIQGAVQGRDIVFVAVPTPHEQHYDGREPSAHLEPVDFRYDIVKEVLAEANRHMTKDQFWCLSVQCCLVLLDVNLCNWLPTPDLYTTHT